MTKQNTLPLISQMFAVCIISAVASCALSFLSQGIILSLVPEFKNIAGYHSRILIPIFAFYFSVLFIITGVKILPFPAPITSITLSFLTISFATLDFYNLIVIDTSKPIHTTNIPFYASLAGTLFAYAFVYIAKSMQQRVKRK